MTSGLGALHGRVALALADNTLTTEGEVADIAQKKIAKRHAARTRQPVHSRSMLRTSSELLVVSPPDHERVRAPEL